MSKIKDLLAEDQNIEDLVRPFYMELGERAVRKAYEWEGRKEWFRKNAEYETSTDDEGNTEYYFENFAELCEQAITDMVDSIIEGNALDVSDQTYSKAIEYGTDWLKNLLADFESECVGDFAADQKYVLDELKERNGEY